MYFYSMTKNEQIQQAKNQALNEIRKIYHPKYKFPYSNHSDEEGSYGEQREYRISAIVEELEKKIETIKRKYKPENA